MKGLRIALIAFVMIVIIATFVLIKLFAATPDEFQVAASSVFADYPESCFVLLDVKQGEFYRFNEKQTEIRFTPASTFKIWNSIFALQAGVIEDENTVFKWDGRQRSRKELDQDHNLKSAIRFSVVWYFQEIARRIGRERMQGYIDSLGYGNRDISGPIDEFWLGNSIKISADEQVDLLKKMISFNVPFERAAIETVTNCLNYDYEGYDGLYAKTGTAYLSKTRLIGWFVGFVKKGSETYVFATNILGKGVTGFRAKDHAIKLLHQLNILDNNR